jgi:hypothetical protein
MKGFPEIRENRTMTFEDAVEGDTSTLNAGSIAIQYRYSLTLSTSYRCIELHAFCIYLLLCIVQHAYIYK